MRQAFICEHCPDHGRIPMTEEEAVEHEMVCHWNPENKHCLTCQHFGTVFYMAQDYKKDFFRTSTRGCQVKHIPVNSPMISGCSFHEPYENADE